MWGVDPEVDRQVADPLVGSCHPVSLVLDFFLDSVEVHELLALTVQKLPVF